MQLIVDSGKVLLKEQIKPEMHASVVEVGTKICRDIREAREEVTSLRSGLATLPRKRGFRIAASGTSFYTLE